LSLYGTYKSLFAINPVNALAPLVCKVLGMPACWMKSTSALEAPDSLFIGIKK
jgi:hypothetical protein